ncbi:Sec-independent periplasmic protein translocase [Halorubrum distributum JCM 9100]|uniref:Sec-independent protein translocase protein TatC n=5 Tax=Halorubrum distributum TaxID=29283 RepID=M0EB95_9EURY|nr:MULTISPECIES: twin-arginine translocase subunit TatC [Halorubrum distributum group]ELZ31281.1 Sec-independent periplasmic protein translocase [Halorubrum terrestre JCM 10247]ELZ45056.1 Sec-independent periplasmic protein translocase [Halorubrum distributum JCM 9100]ELZ51332.1 Sec-independent periplasmic protein translocase [Halorubrum distributum JCM 10118]EMA60527.1 Sec-independent periplasmic protein translocase [Halorubrum litoreum JCM 13561]MYL16452.1 MFS transporter [Halorubrum terrest
MDDSDRSRDDDSAAADGSTDEAEPGSDGAVDGGSEADEPDDSPASESVESEVTAEVEPEVGSAESDADESADERPETLSDPDEVVEAEDAGRSDALDDESESDQGSVDDAAGAGTEAAGDGGAPATTADAADPATAGVPATEDDEPFDGIEGPETDEEMPLAAHIEEMMRRLAVVFLIGGLATLVVVTESTELINYFWSYHIPAPMENRPRLYGPLELPLTRLKVAGLAGVVVGLPAFVYETYRFMRPGLYQTERRYYLAAVPTSLVLGGIGIAFAHFLVLPAIFSYFTTYTADAATIAFGLAETFNLIVIMLAFMAIVFQIPLFIMLAIMMNLVTRQWLEAKRLIFWGSFLGIAFLFSPDPTGMAPIIVTLTMIALFEGTLAILRWTGN